MATVTPLQIKLDTSATAKAYGERQTHYGNVVNAPQLIVTAPLLFDPRYKTSAAASLSFESPAFVHLLSETTERVIAALGEISPAPEWLRAGCLARAAPAPKHLSARVAMDKAGVSFSPVLLPANKGEASTHLEITTINKVLPRDSLVTMKLALRGFSVSTDGIRVTAEVAAVRVIKRAPATVRLSAAETDAMYAAPDIIDESIEISEGPIVRIGGHQFIKHTV